MSVVDTVVEIEYPLHELTGTTRSVAIADRCLQEAMSGNDPDLELEMLVSSLPEIKWHTMEKELIGSSNTGFDRNYLLSFHGGSLVLCSYSFLPPAARSMAAFSGNR